MCLMSLYLFFIFLLFYNCPHLYICIVCMYIWLNCIYLYLNVYCQCLMLTVCSKGLRVMQFQFSVCMYCTCGRIDNKTLLDYLLDLTTWVPVAGMEMARHVCCFFFATGMVSLVPCILCILVSFISHRPDRKGTLASDLKAPPPPVKATV